MRLVNYSEARNSLKAVLDATVDDADVTVITRRDGPDAVVMSLEQYNSIMATLHLLSSPANASHLAKSVKEYRQGKAKPRKLAAV
jgi:antitoxin YefM